MILPLPKRAALAAATTSLVPLIAAAAGRTSTTTSTALIGTQQQVIAQAASGLRFAHFPSAQVAAAGLLLASARVPAVAASAASQPTFQQQQQQQGQVRNMASNAASPASGSVKDSEGKEVDAKTYQYIQDAQELFRGKPSLEIFKRSWDVNAVFADPICHAQGWNQYAPQWYAMPKAFKNSRTISWALRSSTPERIEFAQDHHYEVRGLGTVKEMHSLVVMELNEQGKIKHFEDRWDEKPMPSGSIAWFFRRLNARTVPLLVSYPKEGADELKKEL